MIPDTFWDFAIPVVIILFVLRPEFHPTFLPEVSRVVDSFFLATQNYPYTISPNTFIRQLVANVITCSHNLPWTNLSLLIK